MLKHYDVILVGAGLFNAVLANRLIKKNKTVLIIDKRNHIAGNCYSENRDNIDIHVYGPHVFHTSNKTVWEFMKQFTEFKNIELNTMAYAENKMYNLPFNMNTFSQVYNIIEPAKAKEFIQNCQNNSKIPSNLEEQAIKLVGQKMFDLLIKGYTEKQWGRKCTELSPDIIKRLPVRYTFNNNYFNDTYQGIPVDGYTKMVENMIKGCDVLLNTNFLDDKAHWESMADHVYYSGSIDEYYNYKLGVLEYRRVRFETEKLNIDNYQGVPVVNYTTHEQPYTRVIEHKMFNNKINIPITYVTKEYSSEWKQGDDPYYPISNITNNTLYKQYIEIPNNKVNFVGRLGLYKYMDMDDIVETALLYNINY